MSDQEIADLCRRLADVLEDGDGCGMASWQLVRTQLGRELHTALDEALGEPEKRTAALADEYQRGYSEGYSQGDTDGYSYASDDGS